MTAKEAFELLGCHPREGRKRLKARWRFWAYAWHPDRWRERGATDWQRLEAEEHCKQVNLAYDVARSYLARGGDGSDWREEAAGNDGKGEKELVEICRRCGHGMMRGAAATLLCCGASVCRGCLRAELRKPFDHGTDNPFVDLFASFLRGFLVLPGILDLSRDLMGIQKLICPFCGKESLHDGTFLG